MRGRDYVGEFEHIIVLALPRLEDRAYGVTVRQEIEFRTNREVSIGAVYATLDRLEVIGHVKSPRRSHSRTWRTFETILSCYRQGSGGCEPRTTRPQKHDRRPRPRPELLMTPQTHLGQPPHIAVWLITVFARAEEAEAILGESA
jgi:hypothetical protein